MQRKARNASGGVAGLDAQIDDVGILNGIEQRPDMAEGIDEGTDTITRRQGFRRVSEAGAGTDRPADDTIDIPHMQFQDHRRCAERMRRARPPKLGFRITTRIGSGNPEDLFPDPQICAREDPARPFMPLQELGAERLAIKGDGAILVAMPDKQLHTDLPIGKPAAIGNHDILHLG